MGAASNSEKSVLIPAILVTLLVAGACLLVNVEHMTLLPNSRTPPSAVVPVGYGWPLAGVRGTLARHDAFYPSQFWSRWPDTKNREIVWLGLTFNIMAAFVLMYSVFSWISWVQERLQLRFTLAFLLGLTLFTALAVLACNDYSERYTDVKVEVVARQLVLDLLPYARSVVWGAVFVGCMWIPGKLVALMRCN